MSHASRDPRLAAARRAGLVAPIGVPSPALRAAAKRTSNPRAVVATAVIGLGVLLGLRPPTTATTTVATTRPTTQPTPTPVAVTAWPVTVPIEVLPSGHIAVRAKVNGRGPYRFVFDTGAPSLLIGEQTAHLAGVLPAKFRRPFFTIMGNLGNHPAKSIDLAGAVQRDMSAQVWNHPTVDLLSKVDGPLAGIVGFPFFARYRTTIDYQHHTITLAPSAYEPVDTEAKLRAYMEGDETDESLAPAVMLGVRVAKGAKDEAPGVDVAAVTPGGPADQAGVRAGDRLLTIDNRWTDAVVDCYAAAAALPAEPGRVAAKVRRGGAELTVQLDVKPGI